MAGWQLTVLGFVAGVFTTFGFLPQLLKAWRSTDVEAISKRTYVISSAAFALWIVYGVMTGRVPIIVFNALSLAFSGAILVLKLRALKSAAGS
jgi:MtN3 and saliva related transmembrane protein